MPFGYSAIGGLLGQMEEAKRRMQQPLAPPPDAFQLPQQGSLMPPAPPQSPMPDPMANVANANISDLSDPTHGHKRGVRGILPHLLGTDRVAPEVAALLSPDQIKRVKPGVVGSLWNAINYGKSPQTVMQDRANNMLALTDAATRRKEAAEMARKRAMIATDYANMPNDPIQRYAALSEMTGRLAAIGHPDATKYANILNAIKPDAPKEATEQRVTWSTTSAEVDGKPMRIRTSNTGLVTDMAGNDISQRDIAPWATPVQQSFSIPSNVVGTGGNPVVFNSKTGKYEERADLGVKPPQGGAAAPLPNTAIEKMIALDDAIAAAESAQDALGEAGYGPKAKADAKKLDITGRVGGFIPVPNWARNQVGQGGEVGRSLRSKIGNLTSMIGNLRSGGAITPQEFERLETFLPTPNDKEEDIDGKLRDFLSFLKDMKKTRIAAYQKYGKGGESTASKIASYEEWKASQGMP